jgi:alkylation response protein AidB-like acyl-CoA dehydrogenase
MNFDFTDDQQAIKRTANELLAARFKPEHVRELAESGSYDDDAWKEMSELGWAGIFVDEGHGGQGLGVVELVILMEELGYALAPVPFLSNAAAGLALQVAGSDEQKERWLPGIASGEARGTVGLVRDGPARLVPDADSAQVIVLLSADGGTVVEAAQAEVEPFDAMDRTRRFARVRADAGDPLPGDSQAALDRIAAALSAETVGVSQKALEMAVEYARERKQFGRPIGSFQALQHRFADLATDLEAARLMTWWVASLTDEDPDRMLPKEASMVKLFVTETAQRVALEGMQMMGGYGYSSEYDMERLVRAALVSTIYGGTSEIQRGIIAKTLGL